MSQTIYALSSGAPPSAIGVLRISGPHAFAAVERMAGSLPAPRRASLRRLRDPATGDVLDRALVIVFPGPATASGEDLAELHLHGGRAVIRAVERVLSEQPGLRHAQPGEFTRRALESGRIDLTEAEGLADLLAAETESQRYAAMRSSEGHLRRTIEQWSDRAVALAAIVEAAIDYSDEADAADDEALLAHVRAGAAALAKDMAAVLAQPSVDRLRDGIRVVFAGPPNSGKSTLFNAMIGREAAIVSPIAGTTRDRIEASVVRDGVAWLLVDTAGLADTTDDPIESIGIVRARESMEQADIVLWLGDGDPEIVHDRTVLVHARRDQPERRHIPPGKVAGSASMPGDVASVWDAVTHHVGDLVPQGDATILNERQRRLCRTAHKSLCDAAYVVNPLITAEHLRVACASFDSVTGRAHTEAVLDALFGTFCIGK